MTECFFWASRDGPGLTGITGSGIPSSPMAPSPAPPRDPSAPSARDLDVGIRLHVRQWPGEKRPFLLLHGLASNNRTWDAVGAILSEAGHPVVAPDQRGHGLSEKPASGYDFETITGDIKRLLDALGWSRPLVVGQSWGGNVVLEFAARHPGRAWGLGLVDGGYLDLRARPGATWERVAEELRPPNLLGTPRESLERWLRAAHPDWSPWGIEATLANFETLPDGTVRPWLSLGRHLAILRALWDEQVADLYPRVREPVLICAADRGNMEPALRDRLIAAADAGLARSAIHRFAETDHDVHVHRPDALTGVFLEELSSGIWAEETEVLQIGGAAAPPEG